MAGSSGCGVVCGDGFGYDYFLFGGGRVGLLIHEKFKIIVEVLLSINGRKRKCSTQRREPVSKLNY